MNATTEEPPPPKRRGPTAEPPSPRRVLPKRRCRREREETRAAPPGPHPIHSLPLDACVGIASYLCWKDVKSLRLAARGVKETNLRDPLLTRSMDLRLRPLHGRGEYEAFAARPDVGRWFNRRAIRFHVDDYFRECSALFEGGCLRTVEKVYVKQAKSYHFLYRLGDVPALKRVFIKNCKVAFRKHGGAYPDFVPNLEAVAIHGSRVSPALLHCIATAEGLKILTIEGCSGGTTSCTRAVNNELCTLFGGLEKLESVRVSQSGLSSKIFLPAMCTCEHLKKVELHVDGDISPLTRLRHLETLSLSSNRSFESRDFRLIGQITTLTRFSAKPCWKTGGGLRHLTHLTNLQHMILSKVIFIQRDIVALGTMRNLKTLRSCAVVFATDLSPLQSLHNLQLLSLQVFNRRRCQVMEQIGRYLSDGSLTTLSFGEKGFVQGLEGMANMTGLRSLSVASIALSNAALKVICTNLTLLEDLSLFDCRTLTESGLTNLQKLASLTKLTLQHFQNVKPTSFLKKLSRLGTVEVLKLFDCDDMIDVSLEELGEMKKLTTVHVCPYENDVTHLPEYVSFHNKR